MRNIKKIAIVGAGASGMVAAIEAKRAGARPVLFEMGKQTGKKLSLTGNGRCNFTNRSIPENAYHGNPFVRYGLSIFGPEESIEFFRGLGIEPKFRGDYVYPNSDQAASVGKALFLSLQENGIPLYTETKVCSIRKKEGGFLLDTEGEKHPRQQEVFDRVILSCGSKAFLTGEDGGGYRLAESLGHHILRPVPALCALYCNERSFFEKAQGVRTDAVITLFGGKKKLASDRGELQLTKNGLSGIPVFQISRYVSQPPFRGRGIKAVVDFLPDTEDVFFYLSERRRRFCPKTATDFGNGLLAHKLWGALLHRAGIQPEAPTRSLEATELRKLGSLLKESTFAIERTAGFEHAQVCRGGVDTREVEETTMESKLEKGVYITGELLDVDGICGGFNLQWAWTSGYLAGRSGAGYRAERKT